MNNLKACFPGLGKRKTSVAKIFLTEGSGIITINNQTYPDFLIRVGEEGESIKNPFLLLNLNSQYDVDIKVKGGGVSAQLDAIQLGLSRALCKANQEYRPILNQNLCLRRDSRIKERRKYGLKKARKASQYSKR